MKTHVKKLDEFSNIDLSSNRILNMAHEIYNEYLNNFNILDIPKSIKDVEIDYEFVSKFASDVSESAIIGINENTIVNNVEPISDVVKNLQAKYKINGMLFTVYDPFGVKIVKVENVPNYLQSTNSVLLPYIIKSVNTIKEEFKNNGYYCVNERQYFDKDTNRDWVMLIFDPIKQDDISTQIRNNCDILYHCSPLINNDSILKNGLIPKNEGRIYHYYEDRVYLHTNSPKSSEFKKMMQNITQNRKRLDNSFDGKYNLYYIDVNLLDNEFFKDPHGINSIYTKTKVPANAIVRSIEVVF